MSHRKKTSRAALAARRERLKEDGAKRSCPSSPTQHKKRRRHTRPPSPSPLTPLDDVVMVSDASDLEVKSDISQHSNNTEEGNFDYFVIVIYTCAYRLSFNVLCNKYRYC